DDIVLAENSAALSVAAVSAGGRDRRKAAAGAGIAALPADGAVTGDVRAIDNSDVPLGVDSARSRGSAAAAVSAGVVRAGAVPALAAVAADRLVFRDVRVIDHDIGISGNAPFGVSTTAAI